MPCIRGWHKFPEKLSVSFCDMPRTVYTDVVVIVFSNLNNDTSVVPLFWCSSMLILDVYMITELEGRKLLGASAELCGLVENALGVGFLSGFCCLLPLFSWDELARL